MLGSPPGTYIIVTNATVPFNHPHLSPPHPSAMPQPEDVLTHNCELPSCAPQGPQDEPCFMSAHALTHTIGAI